MWIRSFGVSSRKVLVLIFRRQVKRNEGVCWLGIVVETKADSCWFSARHRHQCQPMSRV